MDKTKIVSGIVSLSLLVSVFSAKKIIDLNIEKKQKQKVAVELFFKSYPYKLSSDNLKTAQKIVDRLYNDSLIFEKMYKFHQTNIQSKESLLRLVSKKTLLNSDSALKVIESQNNQFNSLVKELYSDKQTKKNLDSLFSIFSTNTAFKNKYNLDLMQTKLKQNPVYLIDKGFLFNRKPVIEKNTNSFNFDNKKKVRSFTDKVSEKKKTIQKRGPRR